MQSQSDTHYLDNLNPFQAEAVNTLHGPVLILAAAGTGKTKTLVSRISHILHQSLAYPNEILAVTFTNKAASEMSHRVSESTSFLGKVEWLGTFHAIAAKILRAHSTKVGLKNNFIISDYNSQLNILKNIITEEYPDLRERVKVLLEKIQRWKDRGLSPSAVKIENINYFDSDLIDIYKKYQLRMLSLNTCDFGDLINFNVEIFTEFPEILKYYQNKFRYIMIDEYQDTNAIQYKWITLLAKLHKNICCVGDDDQSIYSWRGAEIKNILNFPNDFPDAKIIKLERNYRSTKRILSIASSVIRNNSSRLTKELWTKQDDGSKVKIVKLTDSEDEASYIARKILKLKSSGVFRRNSDFAILLRAGFQTRVIEEYLMRYSIPHKIVGGTKFYNREEIRDIIAYIKLITNNDESMSFDRIINKPRRGIGSVTINKIYRRAVELEISELKASLLLAQDGSLSKNASTSIKNFSRNILKWSNQYKEYSVPDLIQCVIDEFDYISFIKNNSDYSTRLENLNELISSSKDYEDAISWLEHTSLSSTNDGESIVDEVSVTTLHSSKGLEFPCVFLPGWEEGVFPHQKSIESKYTNDLEEERRLAYVGITRARDELFILRAERRCINNHWIDCEDSRFIHEILEEDNNDSIDIINIGCNRHS